MLLEAGDEPEFPFLFGGTFIEGTTAMMLELLSDYFPSFSEGLSLRAAGSRGLGCIIAISLPFRRDFH